jgi:transposase-like protein
MTEHKWRKEFEEFGEGCFGKFKTFRARKIHELEKRLKDAALEGAILKKINLHFFQERR